MMFRSSFLTASLLVVCCTFPLILPVSARKLSLEQEKFIPPQAEVAELKSHEAKGARRRLPTQSCNPNAKRDPNEGPFFETEVPNALAPDFKYDFEYESGEGYRITISAAEGIHDPGFSGCDGAAAKTKIYGYGANGIQTWPGKTFEVSQFVPYEITWDNNILPGKYIITGADGGEGLDFSDFPVVDKTLHWAYSLFMDSTPTIKDDGVPLVTHLHGGFNDVEYDGNPEFFYNYDLSVVGPDYETNTYVYRCAREASALFYHDHSLGLTRLNVYAGLVGFYIIRDNYGDTGEYPNELDLPVYPYEVALALQDHMFKNNGEHLYPAFPGDPGYDEFITDNGVKLSPPEFPHCDNGDPEDNQKCGPTALAEFFGDHMVVNGKVWPKMDVEPRQYRLRLLNGCDSRFLLLQFIVVGTEELEPRPSSDDAVLDFYVIGTDQGFKSKGTGGVKAQSKLLMAPGERYDVIVNFKPAEGFRVLMWNSGGDAPFGGLSNEGGDGGGRVLDEDDDYVPEGNYDDDYYGHDDVEVPDAPDEGEGEGGTSLTTSRVMAFDVVTALSSDQPKSFDIDVFNAKLDGYGHGKIEGKPSRIRKVGLFEGSDDYGRLQPLLGTAEPATDSCGNPIFWPPTEEYADVGLTGQVEGTAGWQTQPSTENPKKGSTEIWEIWNLTPDAHPIHLHSVFFEVRSRHEITFDVAADMDGMCQGAPTTGVCLETQPLVEHNGAIGEGRIIKFPPDGGCPTPECFGPELDATGYTDIGYPKDLVTANPGEVTVIKVKFQKTGPFVWHCHVLSHEDHEMMRVMFIDGEDSCTGRKLRGGAEEIPPSDT